MKGEIYTQKEHTECKQHYNIRRVFFPKLKMGEENFFFPFHILCVHQRTHNIQCWTPRDTFALFLSPSLSSNSSHISGWSYNTLGLVLYGCMPHTEKKEKINKVSYWSTLTLDDVYTLRLRLYFKGDGIWNMVL